MTRYKRVLFKSLSVAFVASILGCELPQPRASKPKYQFTKKNAEWYPELRRYVVSRGMNALLAGSRLYWTPGAL